MATTESSTSAPKALPNPGGKTKQTRRRQRLSCVECARRRQKCDRQIPCGLCTARGIPDLCRWEPIVVRPAPQRAPVQALQTQNNTVEALLARVSALEEALHKKEKEQHARSSLATTIELPATNDSSDSGNSSSPEEEYPDPWEFNGASRYPSGELKLLEKQDGPVALINLDVQIAAVALAQLSLAPKTEYVGVGSVLSAIHKLGDPELCKVSYAQTGVVRTHKTEPGERPVVSPIRGFLAQLPPRNQVEELINIFFLTRNAEFGISEVWFRAATQTMWYYADKECCPGCPQYGCCSGCREEVNPHWLSLFFAVLSITPFENGSEMRSKLFYNALACRRLIEDILHASAAEVTDRSLVGSVLSCLASTVLAAYLVEHGRVSEAWKVVGGALRCALALGLHRDAQWRRWENMGAVERELRTLTWWLLVNADRQYSFILGRPVMTQRGTFETATLPAAQHGDGSPNPHVLFRKYMCTLSEIISDSTMKCLQWESPTYQTISELGERFKKWEQDLPARFRWRVSPNPKHIPDDDAPPTPPRLLAYQRVLLCAWSLDTAMSIHRLYLMESPPANAHPDVLKLNRTKRGLNPARECCIALAIELTRILLQFHEESSRWPVRERMTPTLLAFFTFDGAIALAGALSQVPPHPQAAECLKLFKHAMIALEDMAVMADPASDREGETPKKGIVVLRALLKSGGWDSHEQEQGAPDTRGFMGSVASHLPSDGQDVPVVDTISTSSYASEFSSSYPPKPTVDVHQSTSQDSRSSHGSPMSNHSSSSYSSSSPPYNLAPPEVFPPPMASSIYTSSPADFGNLPESFISTASSVNAMNSPPSMIMPYDLLQNTIPSSSDSATFDMDWVKLTGMDSQWYGGGNGLGDDGQGSTIGNAPAMGS
ncbi:Oaf3p [Steccherinum ochraceum]|uniref:Oaf3p n=1 Tax=Steccherinum ochraceum TaxID=92696 RepID=A0A4R0RJS1_9APHY|nr:Oaf3p [Steccherinum ochraceum]